MYVHEHANMAMHAMYWPCGNVIAEKDVAQYQLVLKCASKHASVRMSGSKVEVVVVWL